MHDDKRPSVPVNVMKFKLIKKLLPFVEGPTKTVHILGSKILRACSLYEFLMKNYNLDLRKCVCEIKFCRFTKFSRGAMASVSMLIDVSDIQSR